MSDQNTCLYFKENQYKKGVKMKRLVLTLIGIFFSISIVLSAPVSTDEKLKSIEKNLLQLQSSLDKKVQDVFNNLHNELQLLQENMQKEIERIQTKIYNDMQSSQTKLSERISTVQHSFVGDLQKLRDDLYSKLENTKTE